MTVKKPHGKMESMTECDVDCGLDVRRKTKFNGKTGGIFKVCSLADGIVPNVFYFGSCKGIMFQ